MRGIRGEMTEAQAYDMYSQAKTQVLAGLEKMKQAMNDLNFDATDVEDDIRDMFKDIFDVDMG